MKATKLCLASLLVAVVFTAVPVTSNSHVLRATVLSTKDNETSESILASKQHDSTVPASNTSHDEMSDSFDYDDEEEADNEEYDDQDDDADSDDSSWSSVPLRSLQTKKMKRERPPYFTPYRKMYGRKTFKMCQFLADDMANGKYPQTGDVCPTKKQDYFCLWGEQSSCSSKGVPDMPESAIHPTNKCTCDVSTGLFSCETIPCNKPTGTLETCPVNIPVKSNKPTEACAQYLECEYSLENCCDDSIPASMKQLARCTCAADGYFKCAKMPLKKTCARVKCPDKAIQLAPPVGDEEKKKCPSKTNPLVTYESESDTVCDANTFACIAPLVQFNIPGCGCGCQPNPKEGEVSKTCPVDKQPEIGSLCDWDPSENCQYGNSCCCDSCFKPTTCYCDEKNRVMCNTMMFDCIFPCPGGDSCGGITSKTCTNGNRCVDDASDDCDASGKDCMGFCVGPKCPDEKSFTYVSVTDSECSAKDSYECPVGFKKWSHEGCGCGCTADITTIVPDGPPTISECPPKSSDVNYDMVCTKDLRCSWGKETCCGKTHSSFGCSCRAGETMGCYYTDACLMGDCSYQCPKEKPKTGDKCDASLFTPWYSDFFNTGKKCVYGGPAACACAGSVQPFILTAQADHANTCECVDDKWACVEFRCPECPALDIKPAGSLGTICDGVSQKCNEGLVCADNPNDSCIPKEGAIVCDGMCLDPACPFGPGVTYKADGAIQCELVKCDPEKEEFWSHEGCGCGCKPLDHKQPEALCDIENEACSLSTLIIGATTCPKEPPTVGDLCAPTYVQSCSYGKPGCCGDYKSFQCVDGEFKQHMFEIADCGACKEDVPGFPWFLHEQTCTKPAGYDPTDTFCRCFGPPGPRYYCNCGENGKYDCYIKNNNNMIACSCMAPPEPRPVLPDPPVCPETKPKQGDKCALPNYRCWYDEVCGDFTTSMICNEYSMKWGWEEAWAPDCRAEDAIKSSWPELVGKECDDLAVTHVLVNGPPVLAKSKVTCVDQYAMVTKDIREDRVRIFYEADGTSKKIVRAPKIE